MDEKQKRNWQVMYCFIDMCVMAIKRLQAILRQKINLDSKTILEIIIIYNIQFL